MHYFTVPRVPVAYLGRSTSRSAFVQMVGLPNTYVPPFDSESFYINHSNNNIRYLRLTVIVFVIKKCKMVPGHCSCTAGPWPPAVRAAR